VTSAYAVQDTSGSGSTFAYLISGATYRAHTHSVDVAATTSGAESVNLSHTVSGSVTAQAATSTSSSTNGGTLTPKATLLNFIIKT
jgi:hypothetical protein